MVRQDGPSRYGTDARCKFALGYCLLYVGRSSEVDGLRSRDWRRSNVEVKLRPQVQPITPNDLALVDESDNVTV